MALSCGLVGLPLSGKTTFYNLLTEGQAPTGGGGKLEANRGMARVPDQRVDSLSALYQPRKTTYAQIEVIDVPGLSASSGDGRGKGHDFWAAVREVDALVPIIRVFKNSLVPPPEGSIDPVRDIENLNLELLLADYQLVDKRIERIRSGKKITQENQKELALLERVHAELEKEQGLGQITLTEEERAVLQHLYFFTDKPMVLVINVDEGQWESQNYPQQDQVEAWAEAHGVPLMTVCAQIEAEVNQLEGKEREDFLQELNIQEPGIARLARMVYHRLGLISFLTVGEDEVRAWTLRAGTRAKEAAGKIHSDLERGFIRAEVVKYQDLNKLGSMAKVRDSGLFRLEGKEYIVEDGDIINFRFNV